MNTQKDLELLSVLKALFFPFLFLVGSVTKYLRNRFREDIGPT